MNPWVSFGLGVVGAFFGSFVAILAGAWLANKRGPEDEPDDDFPPLNHLIYLEAQHLARAETFRAIRKLREDIEELERGGLL